LFFSLSRFFAARGGFLDSVFGFSVGRFFRYFFFSFFSLFFTSFTSFFLRLKGMTSFSQAPLSRPLWVSSSQLFFGSSFFTSSFSGSLGVPFSGSGGGALTSSFSSTFRLS
jgi:hypothetical protein